MEEIKIKLIIKALTGAVLGMILSAFICAFGGNFSDLLADKLFFLMQIIGSGLFGAFMMGGSVVYDIESWSLLQATVTHYLSFVVAFLIACFVLEWFSGRLLLIAFALLTVVYILIWLTEYALWKREIARMNRDLENILKREQGKEAAL
ncbi:MAG: DUF3021 domain-containing protein [Lachnospiraceae bacterium]|nr:DUF3021 domain-containing protein [Lachnospiraceae bacterium]